MPRRTVIAGLLVTVGACSSARVGAGESGQPTMTIPAEVDEERSDPSAVPEGGDAGVSKAEPTPSGHLPDPEALQSKVQYEYVFVYDRGRVSVGSVRRLLFEEPLVTPRSVGRYAVELWIGHELIDRVRFDFPMLAADPPPPGPRRPIDEPPRFAPGARAQKTILVPGSDRATRAVLLDRATGEVQELPWPPDNPIDPTPPPAREP